MIVAARVLAEFRDDPNRYADAKSRRNYAGTSPVTRASGIHRLLASYAPHRRPNDAYYLWAFAILTSSPGARSFYDQRRPNGDTCCGALRAVANRLVGGCCT
jgi:Transposase IS116/IS110/IS902 family